ncbi:MAG TPA: pyridoxamine 5'-phosphate oxidase family protein [Candidatus Dormibacteraeota bacterium]|jgi:hypothetical protein
MRPADVFSVLEKPAAKELLASAGLIRLAYTGGDGYPRVIPVGFVWNGSELTVCTAENAPKVAALVHDPRVAIAIEAGGQPPCDLFIRGKATVDIFEGVPPEYLDANRKVTPPEQMAVFETQVRDMYKRMARIRIRPEWAKLIDFQATLPQAIEEIIRSKSA